MIKSMTGFGRGTYTDEARSVVCEIRSVNHRYGDVTVKLPKRYSFAEDKIRQEVKQVISRGKVEVSYSVESYGDSDTDVHINEALAAKYLAHLNGMKESLFLAGEISAEYLASLPDVLKVSSASENEEDIERALVSATREALAAHLAMREAEGKKMVEDLMIRRDLILKDLAAIEERGPKLLEEYNDRLRQRIADLLKDTVEIPEERIALEAAVFADKSNITEELVRLHSHMDQLADILASDDAEGKRLDFLAQEMNREANTIGSKANDLEITTTMLDIKSEVEKIREQVQNIE